MQTRKAATELWTTPEQGAREIFETISTQDFGPEHAEKLSDLLGERVFPHMEPEECLDLAVRLASLPTFVEVSAAMTLLLRMAPLPILCEVWREVGEIETEGLTRAEVAREELRAAAAEQQQAIVEAEVEDDAITAQALREELEHDSAMRVDNAAQALREAAEQDQEAMRLNASQTLAEAEAQDNA